MDLRRGILAAVDQVVINLQKMSRPIQTTGNPPTPFSHFHFLLVLFLLDMRKGEKRDLA